jgi:outer membrane protein TolC
VIDQNLRVRSEKLGLDAARRDAQAERGLFEPEFVASFGLESNRRQNSRERFLSSGGAVVFDEENILSSSALEATLPPGTRIRLGAQTRRLDNSLQTPGVDEYESFAGVSVTQPLLRNAGTRATLAQIRIAAAQSEVVLHETRRQLTSILSQAELTFWDLARAVAELDLREASVKAAETILADNRARLEAGRMSELEVRRAEAGVALRRAQALEAHQRVVDLSSLLRVYFGETEQANAPGFRPVDPLATAAPAINFSESCAMALMRHPGYLARRAQLEQAGLRVDYARNQRLPQLDLRASYGYNGLDRSLSRSWSTIGDADYPSWFIGAELRVPIIGNVRGSNQLGAARARQQAALLDLTATEIEISNLMNSLIKRLRNQEAQISAYQAAADVAQVVLDAELAALEEGSSDSRRVLDAEQDLIEARATVLGALGDFRRTCVEFLALEGTFLSRHSAEIMPEVAAVSGF